MTMSASLPAPAKLSRPSLPTDRYWKLDYAKLDLGYSAGDATPPAFAPNPAAQAQGVVLCSLAEAQHTHPELVELGLRSSIAEDETRFTKLASEAAASSGFFCYVPAGVRVAQTLHITIGSNGSWRGRGVVILGAGADAALTEEHAAASADAVMCGTVEVVLAPHACVRYTAIQDYAPSVRSFFTRRAIVEADASVTFATAELGALVSQSYVDARLTAPGARVEVSTIAFATHERYLDLGNDLEHASPHTTSNTVVKAAAVHHGRGRYYGNIRIKEHAHGSEASLRDDTLLLSPDAHIDSVPALEIAANDVKAFHGATVGSVDAEQLFYAMSRGLSAGEAERMITLGFFEPAIARFPEETVREFLRTQLAERVGG